MRPEGPVDEQGLSHESGRSHELGSDSAPQLGSSALCSWKPSPRCFMYTSDSSNNKNNSSDNNVKIVQ